MKNKFSTYLFLAFGIVFILEISCKKDDETPKVVKTHFNPELKYDTVSDFDKHIYKTIAIGQQIWLAENLKTTHYSDGTPIPYYASNSDWSGLTTGGYCWNDNDIKNKNIYGGIYNFYAVIDSRNVCPSGWHVPTYNDWYILQQGLGGDQFVGGHLKEIEFDHWVKPNTGADNSSGFTALPASGRSAYGDFGVSGYGTGIWTSTEDNLTNAWWSDLGYDKSYLGANSGLKTQGLSIRCIKDEFQLSTISIADISQKTATVQGFVYCDYPLALVESGMCWGTEQEPTILGDLSKNLTGMGYFSCLLKNLTASTRYFVRTYAIFKNDTIYGEETYFETSSNTAPTISTISVNEITPSTVKCIVNINKSGGLAIIARGVCWSTSANPTADLTTKTIDGVGIGGYTSSITGLIENTDYYIRAYATNSQGTTYGNEIKIKTPIASLPTLTTITPTNIKATSATSGGNVIFDGNLPIIARGICWSTSQNPTVDLPTKIINGFGRGIFSSSITDLIDNTVYYIRAYATNSLGTSYGDEKSFRTSNFSIPALQTNIITNISFTSATCKSSVYSDGDLAVVERGYCWGTSPNPTIENGNKLASGAGLGDFTCNILGLTEGTKYYVKPYAVNGKGVAYGVENSFTTLMHSIPSISYINISKISFTSAECEGNVNNDGYLPIIERGIFWSTSPNSTIENGNKIVSGSTTSIFTCNITGLSEGAKYYVKGYAINSMGIGYGAELNFTTLKHSVPILSDYMTNIGSSNADCNVIINSDGYCPVNERGICWSTSPNPTIESGNKIVSSSTTSNFTCKITGLSDDTKYYVRGYAINSMGVGYGAELSFTTLKVTIPIISGISTNNITYSSAYCDVYLSNDGNTPLIERGICWSTIPNPTIENGNKIISETKMYWSGSNITGLEPNTTYYVVGYAINGKGVGYSVERSFKTLALTVPKLTTSNASYVTPASLTIGGSITDDGGTAITERGICWSTTPNPTIELNNKVSLGMGSGFFSGNITGLSENIKYYFRSYAINSLGICYGNEVVVIIYFGNVTDIDGNVYNTLAIGEQIWMKENLKTTKYSNGDPIPNIVSDNEWNDQRNGAYCWYNNDIKYKVTYGALYNGYTIIDSRKVCPTGWHIPSEDDWDKLTTYLGGEDIAGGKMKSTNLWESPNTGGDNSSGFAGLPAGIRTYYSGSFYYLSRGTSFWGIFYYNNSSDYSFIDKDLYYTNTSNSDHTSVAIWGKSIRCMKDE